MNKILKAGLNLTFIILFLNACSAFKIVKQDNNHSIIAISATSTGPLTKGYGMIITIENVATQEKLISKSFSALSPHCVIQNVPPGKYIIRQVEVFLGNYKYINWSDSLTEFFGCIDIEPNSKYYLGNFTGTRIVGSKNVLKMRIENEDIPERLIEEIENKKTGWNEGNFYKLYPYEKDELLIY